MCYYHKIVGKRLYLSPINNGDAASYIKWMNDEHVAKNFGQYAQVVSTKDDLQWIFEPESDMQRFGIVLLEGDVLIGSISIHNIDHLNRNAFIGIFIGEKEQRGKGYGTEAVRLILNYGFKSLNLHNIMLSVHADNLAAIACYKKIGFRETGRCSDWIFKDGTYIDKVFMEMLDHELADA